MNKFVLFSMAKSQKSFKSNDSKLYTDRPHRHALTIDPSGCPDILLLSQS